MIYKEIDPYSGTTKFEKAGYEAEKEMAFFLRRFFKDSAEVDVINSLRIELGGEIAQIDHLILMPHGLLIVESKSVAGKVQIKDDGQWIRWNDNQSKGMRSPITQADMQGRLLRELLSSAVKQKGAFDNISVDILVAISDSGIILWPSSGALPEVCKADQVPERVNAKLAHYNTEPQTPKKLTPENRQKIAQFLRLVHQPRTPPIVGNPVVLPNEEVKTTPLTPKNFLSRFVQPVTPNKDFSIKRPIPICKHCHASHVEIRYGHSYFLYCLTCHKNTPLKQDCLRCDNKARIRKDGKRFFIECADCGTSQLFFTNPS